MVFENYPVPVKEVNLLVLLVTALLIWEGNPLWATGILWYALQAGAQTRKGEPLARLQIFGIVLRWVSKYAVGVLRAFAFLLALVAFVHYYFDQPLEAAPAENSLIRLIIVAGVGAFSGLAALVVNTINEERGQAV